MAKKLATRKYSSPLTVIFDFGGVLSAGTNGFEAVREELAYVSDDDGRGPDAAGPAASAARPASPAPGASDTEGEPVENAGDAADEVGVDEQGIAALEREIAAHEKAEREAAERLVASRREVEGFDADAAQAAYWEHRPALDEGLDPLEYWGRVAAAGGYESLTEEDLENLNDVDQRYWLRLEPHSREVLHELALANVRVGLLSNMASDFAERVRRADWFEAVDFGLFSGDLGCSKPSREIYYVLIETLAHLTGGVERPGNIVFFDDKQENVDAARACGIDAHLWVANGARAEGDEPGWEMARRVLVGRGLLAG
ncbi:HAD-IA family hydrolase [Micrococcales bacterium 31B]|nr:HAD-IA family hydrolase [Micrococcales bacterium 31B]